MSDKNMPKRGAKGTGCPKMDWNVFWKWVSLLCVILTLVIVIIQTATNADALQRYFVVSEPAPNDAQFWGPFTIDSNNNRLLYEFRYVNASAPTLITIRGPIDPPTRNGPIAAYLCGGGLAPQPACNNMAAGIIPEAVVKQIDDGVVSPQQDVRILATKIRKNPHLFYWEAVTATHTFRSFLNGILGTP